MYSPTPFEKLTSLMTNLDGFDLPAIFSTLSELCKSLRISKGITIFYASLEDEQKGNGETFICHDSGEQHVLVSHMRLVTLAQVVIVCDVYQAEGAEPFSESERFIVETSQRVILTHLNRSRQEEIIQRLKYWDDDGYSNLRYFYYQIMQLKADNNLVGKTAVRINLKHFSLVNEQVGKANGDIILRRYTDALFSAMGPGSVLSRLGGDNFVMLFDTVNLPEVEKVLSGVPIPYDGNQRVEVSAVAGIFRIRKEGDINSPGDVMERIIPAYLIAKREHTKDIIFYSDEFKKAKARELRIQRKFATALENCEFQVYYQPKVDVNTKTIVGAEALCRWLHKGKLVPPMDFIPALERGQDICRLDFYMLDHVCKDIRKWLDSGMPVVRISVNLSRRHMMDPDLFEHIVEIIDQHSIPHDLIEIELTETTTDVEFKDLKRVVTQLQDAGINASVDDFGIGYSSLNLIKQIPWDVLKLDKSIIPSKGEDVERGSKMFAHVISMAHEIGMKCVAEGIETEEQLDIMRHYGCRIAQGFLFDKPLPVDDFEQRLALGNYVERQAERT